MLCPNKLCLQQDPKYNKEVERINSFENRWPSDHSVDSRYLARTGMYYVGFEDMATCQFCGVTIKQWERGINPVDIHFAFSEKCPLLLREITPNEPLDFESVHLALPRATDNDLCVPEYADASKRNESFSCGQEILVRNREKLADAGFFYTLSETTLMCFSCGGTVDFINDEENPWEMHNRWYPDCCYLKLMFAKANIPRILATEQQEIVVQPPLNTEEEDDTMFGNLFDEVREEAVTPDIEQIQSTVSNIPDAAETSHRQIIQLEMTDEEKEQFSDTMLRVASFMEAPLVLREIADKLADAGFFYTGNSSTIRCFSCGFTEANWRKEFVPWIVHSVMLGKCEYLTLWQWQRIERIERGGTESSELISKQEIDVYLCNICCMNERNTAFLPCGHTLACANCATILRSRGNCPICRNPITGTQTLYFS